MDTSDDVMPLAQQPPDDPLRLGPTRGQRSAEILAGLRAELTPSPITRALARLPGRSVAWMILRLVSQRAALNFVAVRPAAFAALVRRELPANQSALVVDLAAGFSPRSIELAQALPHVRFIEIDLPDVVTEKQRRLSAHSVSIPANLSWRAADLMVTSLCDVLDGQQADIVTAEGLMAFFPHADVTRIARQIHGGLKPNGVCICDLPWRKRIDSAASRGAINLFRRQSGDFLSVVETPEDARTLMLDAGYAEVEVCTPSELTAEFGLLTPVVDFSLLLVARKGV